MSYNISKELFEAVMDEKVTTEISISPYYNEINGCEENDLILINYNFVWIPLNTFFFKCKEWALEQGYILESSFKDTSICVVYRIINDGWSKTKETSFSRSSEQQAVFNACQWLLDNKDKQ